MKYTVLIYNMDTGQFEPELSTDSFNIAQRAALSLRVRGELVTLREEKEDG